jgi:hypothetical protein
MSNFRPIDRQTGFLLPPSVDEWLPEKHLARLIFTRSGGHLSKLGMIRAEVMDGEYSTGIHG